MEAFNIGTAANGIGVGAGEKWEGCMVFIVGTWRRDGRFGDREVWVITEDPFGRMGWSREGPEKDWRSRVRIWGRSG